MKLPDVNVLVAASVAGHIHNKPASKWIDHESKFATCPITELGLVRVLMQTGVMPAKAYSILHTLIQEYRGRFVPADLSAMTTAGKAEGHRQTTDVYLVELAREHDLTLVTLDRAIATRFPDVVELLVS